MWIVNVEDRQLEVYREPEGEHYRVISIAPASEGTRLAPGAFPELQLDLAELFRFV